MQGDFKDGFTRRYWSIQELAANLKLSRGHLYRLLTDGQMLGPDIIVAANNRGWDPERVARFGQETGRLDMDGRPLTPVPDGALSKAQELVKTRFLVPRPGIFVSSWLASYIYGLQESAVFFIRKREGGFIPADVVVGKKWGWDERRVIEFGLQTGRLDDDKINKWVFRRTAEFGLPADIGWVKARVEERPELAARLTEANELYRKVQEAEEAAQAEKETRARPPRAAKGKEATTRASPGRAKKPAKKTAKKATPAKKAKPAKQAEDAGT